MRMTDCFSETVAYVSYFLIADAGRQIGFDQFSSEVRRLLTESEQYVRNNQVSQDDYNQARFAICAWIDEAILSSNWPEKGRWQQETLQRFYYQTADAGEEFYTRLNSLGLQQQDVREVYFLCLAMGFKGRYCQEGDEFLLEQLKTSNLKLLTGSSLGIPSLERSELFPQSYASEVESIPLKSERWRLSPTTLGLLGSPILLFALLLLIFTLILKMKVASF
ncbi:DotU family type IV/VI secretion system protein [Malonomonas rubra]|uniref:DotU family type IV/VI secretion system protein n=1 Tax=Malonomonas rubra TaxID=57040 RepID=UPI0026F0077E|nr:DotU family type IV/VI secretion system protein [Malonomonas rubra]